MLLGAYTDVSYAKYLVTLQDGQENKKSPQFIITTFRKELVQNANKVLGMAMVNNASRVQEMTKEEALDFIVSQPGN